MPTKKGKAAPRKRKAVAIKPGTHRARAAADWARLSYESALRTAIAMRPQPAVPAHVAILGLGPSLDQYLLWTRSHGGRHKLFDETWGINALGDILQCDRVFHMDDVRIQEIRAAALPDSNIAAMLAWLKTHPGPVYTSRTHPAYPGLTELPLEAMVNNLGHCYFNSTAAWAVAYAVHIGVKKITCFGMDFTYPNAHDAEKGRACVEFWLGFARARGILVAMPKGSTLMDAMCSHQERLYGYDTRQVHLRGKEGDMKVEYTEIETLPSAAEIEDRYDHSKHPSRLVSEAAEESAAGSPASARADRRQVAAHARAPEIK